MQAFIIAYDLYRPGQSYDKMAQAINTLDTPINHCLLLSQPSEKVLRTTWIVQTSKPLNAIVSHLAQALDTNDKLLVAEIGKGIVGTKQEQHPVSLDAVFKILREGG